MTTPSETSQSPVRRRQSLSRLRKPPHLSLETWQVALRRQFAAGQRFRIRNIGGEAVFSEFEVTNPQTRRTYRVAIRGDELGVNYCSCPDFAVNTLGTCKHVESVLRRLRRMPAGRSALAKGFQPTYSEVFLRYGARRQVFFRPGSDCPGRAREMAAQYFDDAGVLRPNAIARFHVFLEKASSDGHELRCYEDALAFVSQLRDAEERIKRIRRAFPDGAEDRAFQSLIKVPLYPYQRQGALAAAEAGRCLIADDMGLGKTVQAVAAAEILARVAGLRRVLVVCPTSLKHQWKREIEKFTGRSALVIEGLLGARARCYAADSFYKITNYDVLCRDLPSIRQWQPELIILDEAQRIKNWRTRTARTVKQMVSDFTFVLTGTPLENRLEELHSIVEFVDRFRLGPMFRFLAAHQHLNEAGRVIGYRQLGEISRTLQPILIRRTKTEVLKELPQRLEKRFFVPMTPQQMRHHEENREIVGILVAKWRRYGYLSEIDQKRLMCALQNMRMACDSTYLLDARTDHGCKADELLSLLSDALEDREAKVVVFSQWVRMHELIADRLARRRWPHVFLHGGVPGPQRRHLIGRFCDDPACRLFLSTDAGGVGLNLQAASVVANMDLPWNPAVLEQRIGRVHRLGQRRPVRVVHFIAKGTIEEGMLSVLSFKKSLFAGVLDGGKEEVFLGGTRLKQFMESVERATTGIPAAMPSTDGPAAPVQAAPAARTAEAKPEPSPPAHPAVAAAASVTPRLLSDLLTAGASFLGQLGQALRAGAAPSEGSSAGGPAGAMVQRDSATGQSYLRLPLPTGQALQQIVSILSAFAGSGGAASQGNG